MKFYGAKITGIASHQKFHPLPIPKRVIPVLLTQRLHLRIKLKRVVMVYDISHNAFYLSENE